MIAVALAGILPPQAARRTQDLAEGVLGQLASQAAALLSMWLVLKSWWVPSSQV